LINNRNLEDENWKFIEVTKINDKIIKDLVQNLKKGLSDDFYISIESLLRIGKKAESELKTSLDEIEGIFNFKRDIFTIILNYIKNQDIENGLLLRLYNPDFTVRARTIMEIEHNQKLSYLQYLLPLVNDPDDSVRWTLINALNNLDQVKNPTVRNKLENQMIKESNPVIKSKLEKILSNN
jgi:hypothetical protein